MTIFILLILIFPVLDAQVTIAKNTQVTPRCGSQLISIEVNFDPTQLPGGKFTDWIIVGVSGRPECRLRGNGETKYIIEIAVFNDPCLTQIPARNVFQNRIRIGKNPVVILEEDQSVTVKCIYGLPTVETMTLPVINSNFNIDNFSQGSQNQAEIQPQLPSSKTSLSVDESNNRESVQEAVLKSSQDTETQSLGIPSLLPNVNMNNLEMESNQNQSPQQFLPTTSRNLKNENQRWEATVSPEIFQNNNFELNSSGSKSDSKRFSFSILFVAAIVLVILLICALFACLLFFLRRRMAIRNRRLLVDRVSDLNDRMKNSETGTWPRHDEYTTTSPRNFENRLEVHQLSMGRKAQVKTITSNETDRGVGQTQNGNGNGRRSLKTARNKKPAPNSNLPLKSNLEEFVSKTYALGEYNNLASPAYAYASEVHDEREVDVGYDKPYSSRKPHPNQNKTEDGAVSSFRSITEIVHAAETASASHDNKPNGNSNEMEKILSDCVLSIRGFGYRKLTEQEIIRWKNLVHQDSNIRELLIGSKSSAEIENIFELDEYKNLFTSSKWHEIAICVHRALTNSLDRSNSRSELQLFVGNVQTDW